MKKTRAKKSPAPSPRPMTRPAMSPVCDTELELLAAPLVAALRVAELLVTGAAVETTVIFCHMDQDMTSRGGGREPTLGAVVRSAKPSIGCAYACPDVLKSITPLELLLSYCVTDMLRMSLKQVPPYPGRPGVEVSGG